VADPNLSMIILVQILDLFGTMAFAVTGAFKAIEHKSDIVGIVILSTITGGCRGSHTGYNIWKISSYCCRQPPLYYNNCEHCNSNFFSLSVTKETLEFIFEV
jgi:hypothetical protein